MSVATANANASAANTKLEPEKIWWPSVAGSLMARPEIMIFLSYSNTHRFGYIFFSLLKKIKINVLIMLL